MDVPRAVSWPAVGAGLGLGLWAGALFSLLPLLPVRRVSPLVLPRREHEPPGRPRRDPAAVAAALALAASVAGLR